MNLSHVITEFSFGPYFPDISQPLDNSFELTHEREPAAQPLSVATLTLVPAFIAYQYFLQVVPTTYIPPRGEPLRTNQYSVTHYTRQADHGQGTPGIFFKFELDPLHIAIHQRTTTFSQLFIR
jgi:endoplasmic reticulum-Golgi intermediate compartment protein 2